LFSLLLRAQQKKNKTCSEKAVGKAPASLIGDVLRRELEYALFSDGTDANAIAIVMPIVRARVDGRERENVCMVSKHVRVVDGPSQ
jgi:hypothetical protein